ncbi:lasso peptide biosynthesis B2 protein [Candidatus Dependentiae bacterium]|nr:lasso peptide biosynthesis B2 protein [Candidatus Dependentiae bacterium]MBU4387495.1 lasso peptide biosynthesis B2 protein [Candidatus Dependentiae bacterium]MCG2756448.1 lasso peptide biosynthesis B2 protein [Candidatus Dependentiae bacterium]
MQKINFSLTPHIYAAEFDNSIIILDSSTDNYLSLIEEAAQNFKLVLNSNFYLNEENKFVLNENENLEKNNLDIEELNEWIAHFIESKYIIKTTGERKFIVSLPLKSGGLIDYQWDQKPSWKPFAKSSKIQIIKAFFELKKIHNIMVKLGIKGILDIIQNISKNRKNLFIPSEKEIERLSSAVDAASLLYKKKTYCLAWAATFVVLALKKNWKCSLEIGVQANPFYAHAWAIINQKVVNDDPKIAQVLAIILKEPNF